MRGCRKCEILLGAYVYEELEPRQRERIVRHLEECERCRETARSYRELRGRIPEDLFQGGAPPPAKVLEGVRAARRWRVRWATSQRRAWVLALALVGMVVALVCLWAEGGAPWRITPPGPALVGAPGGTTGLAPTVIPIPPATPPGSGGSLAEAPRPRGLGWVPVGITNLKEYWRALTGAEGNSLTGEPAE